MLENMFDHWANPFVYLILLKSSMDRLKRKAVAYVRCKEPDTTPASFIIYFGLFKHYNFYNKYM